MGIENEQNGCGVPYFVAGFLFALHHLAHINKSFKLQIPLQWTETVNVAISY